MYNQAVVIAGEEAKDKRDRKESTAVALRLKPKSKSTKTDPPKKDIGTGFIFALLCPKVKPDTHK